MRLPGGSGSTRPRKTAIAHLCNGTPAAAWTKKWGKKQDQEEEIEEEKTDNDWRGEYEAVEHWVTHAEGVLLGKDVPVSTLDAAGESGGRGASQV